MMISAYLYTTIINVRKLEHKYFKSCICEKQLLKTFYAIYTTIAALCGKMFRKGKSMYSYIPAAISPVYITTGR